MVVLNSIKQLMRTPVKTLFFLVLLILTVTFFMLGFRLWYDADQNMQRLESVFVTIGTVEQKATSMESVATWDAELKEYTYRSYPTFGEAVPISALDFPGANYINAPETRPYYCAYSPDYNIATDPSMIASLLDSYFIAEIQPEQDCETGDPVHVTITKVLMGFDLLEGNPVLFCNHFEEKTYKLYADKTYIVGLYDHAAHTGADMGFEYVPWGIAAVQRTKDGKIVESELESATPWDEVTDGFYDTPKGKAWLNYIEAMENGIWHAIPVVTTDYTKLLMPFFNGDARITEGRDITDAEYASGDDVCLVPKSFAEKNSLAVGGSLNLPLIWAEYGFTPAGLFSENGSYGGAGFINADGEQYSIFDNDAYTIVGIYDVAPAYGFSTYSLAGNTVVVPQASIKSSDENNIVRVSRVMRGCATTFRISNGTIDEFMLAWEAQGIDDLEFTFYDKGYSKIKAGLDEMKSIAILMFSVGTATTLFVIILFCNLFITKQRKRTAIERSLGMSKARCTLSLLVGILVIIIPAYICGGLASGALTEWAAVRMNATQTEQLFDTTYSDWVNTAADDLETGITISTEGGAGAFLAGAAMIPIALLIAWVSIRGNLKAEPLKLLGEKER